MINTVHAPKKVRTPSQAQAEPFPDDAPIIELDVREELRKGAEPFTRIMATVAALAPTEVLHLRATFEPVPLLRVMTKRGFLWRVKSHATDDWSVWFYRPSIMREENAIARQASELTSCSVPATPEPEPHPTNGTSTLPTASAAPAPQGSADALSTSQPAADSDVWLDVRDMEPPEPLVRTLEMLERLPTDATLIQLNVRVPQLLLPILQERGFEFTIDDSQGDCVLVRIWRPSAVSSSGV